MKIVKSRQKLGLPVKGIRETIKNKVKYQNGRFLSILSGKLAASTLGNALARKRVIKTGEGVTRAGKTKHYQNEPKIIGIY